MKCPQASQTGHLQLHQKFYILKRKHVRSGMLSRIDFEDQTMTDLTARTDDWSFQIVAEGSKRFFVRVTSPMGSKSSMVFSDFILTPDDNARAIEAFRLLNERGFVISPPMKLVFQDIHPSYSDERDRAELIRRHDQIVGVVKEYAVQAGLTVENTFLNPTGSKFETVAQIE